MDLGLDFVLGEFVEPVIGFIPQVMNGNYSISGRVMSGTKKHPANLLLVTHDTWAPLVVTTTDENGYYQFTGCQSGVLYDVIATDPEGKWETKVSSRREAG